MTQDESAHEHGEVWKRIVEDADMQRTEQMRAAVVWGIVYEKTWAKHEHEPILVEHPSNVTVEEIAASQRRGFLELAQFASKEADRVCRYLEESKDPKETTP